MKIAVSPSAELGRPKSILVSNWAGLLGVVQVLHKPATPPAATF
jgi:hypothetical protein